MSTILGRESAKGIRGVREARRGWDSPSVDTALRDLRRGGSRDDAEITERVRIRPTLIEWGSSVAGGGGWLVSPRERGIPRCRCGAVTTPCPFLLPPIRRHRGVIRNRVSLSSP